MSKTVESLQKFRDLIAQTEQDYSKLLAENELLLEAVKLSAAVMAECSHREDRILYRARSKAVDAIKKVDPGYYGIPKEGA